MEGWRLLPKAYAALVLVTAVAFFLLTQTRLVPEGARMPFGAQLALLRDIVVWRFGLYYFLVFGAFVAIAQWFVPYSVNVYQMSVAQAGLLAGAFSLPSGLIRAAGGWLSDRFGARMVMYSVFLSSVIVCLVLSVPKVDIDSPGEGVSARAAGVVNGVSPTRIVVGASAYHLTPPPEHTPAEIDKGIMGLPRVTSWQEPVVSVNEAVQKKQLLARGVTNIYYPANVWIFAVLLFMFGIATGVGKAGVYKFIPDQFLGSVGAVGGMVGFLGALGGFVFPVIFGYLLQRTGLWSSCWMVLALLSVVCLVWMQLVVRRIGQEEAPELVQLIERRPRIVPRQSFAMPAGGETTTVEAVLKSVPLFGDLTEEQLKEVARIGRIQSGEPNEVVFREGDPGDTLYVILSGAVKVYRTDKQDQEIQLATLTRGDYFGELALIDGEPRSAGVSTIAPCQFFLIGRRDFLTLVSKSPGMLAELLVGLSTTIRRSSEREGERMTGEALQARANRGGKP